MSARQLGAALLIALGYLGGSVSFAYLVARLGRKIDLRQYGGGKLSGSNVYHQVGVLGMVLVGLLDIGKGALPAWLGLRLGHGLGVAVAAGLAAIVGHNWSLYLGLRGGRGIGAALGLLLVIFPWGALWVLGWVFAGRLVPHATAIPALAAFMGLPLLALWQGQPVPTVWGCWGMLALLVAKRLEGNRRPIRDEAWRVLLRRLFLDRDVADFHAWIGQRPGVEEEGR